MEKKCNKCQKIKSVSEFGKESRAKNGYKPRCKECTNAYYNEFYKNWRESKIKYQSEYSKKNRNLIRERSKTHIRDLERKKNTNKLWREKNKEILNKKANEYIKQKIKTDPEFRAIRNMRKLIYRLGIEKKGKTVQILGYTLNDLKNKLGRLPELNESIDHKIPVTWFKSIEYVREINSLENLQILKRNDNSRKNNFYSSEISKEYFLQIKHLIKEEFLPKIKTNEHTINTLEKTTE